MNNHNNQKITNLQTKTNKPPRDTNRPRKNNTSSPKEKAKELEVVGAEYTFTPEEHARINAVEKQWQLGLKKTYDESTPHSS